MIDPTPSIYTCTLCPLHAKRIQAVPGEGNVPARVLFVGEAPGGDEDKLGRPFVGRAGQLLRSTLESVGCDFTEVRITNAVHCRPISQSGSNSTPTVKEIKSCRVHLYQEIEAVQPDIIVALGASALRGLLDDPKLKITEARRLDSLACAYDRIDYGAAEVSLVSYPAKLICCYHPSAALRTPSLMAEFVRDIERVAELAGWKEAVDQSRSYHELSPEAAIALLPELAGQVIGFDTEFENDGELVCFSFSYREAEAFVVIFPPHDSPEEVVATSHWECLRLLLEHAGQVGMHNAKADIPIVESYGVPVPPGKVQDTILLSYILNRKPLGLKSLAQNRLGLNVVRLEELREKGQTIRSIPRTELVRYSAQDADVTRRLLITEWEEIHNG